MHTEQLYPAVCFCKDLITDAVKRALPKTGPLRFGSENQFLLNFAQEYILV